MGRESAFVFRYRLAPLKAPASRNIVRRMHKALANLSRNTIPYLFYSLVSHELWRSHDLNT
jgi:hypothetical protein